MVHEISVTTHHLWKVVVAPCYGGTLRAGVPNGTRIRDALVVWKAINTALAVHIFRIPHFEYD